MFPLKFDSALTLEKPKFKKYKQYTFNEDEAENNKINLQMVDMDNQVVEVNASTIFE